MPDFISPRHGVSLSEALKEAAMVAPVTVAILSTFELWHPTLGDPIYVVNDQQDLVATKEAAAARDPGAEVTYMTASISDERPEESDSAATPEIVLTVANVSGFLAGALRAARGFIDPWTITERVYLSNDTSGPAILPPLELYVTTADISEDGVSLRCSYADPANVSVPAMTFRRKEYPGLVR